MNKLLATHVSNTSMFRCMMKATNSVAVGPSITNFLNHNVTAGHPLALLTCNTAIQSIKAYLEDYEGYEAWEEDGETEKRTARKSIPCKRTSWSGLRSRTLTPAAPTKVEDPIQHVVTMEQTANDGSLHGEDTDDASDEQLLKRGASDVGEFHDGSQNLLYVSQRDICQPHQLQGAWEVKA
ncbi:hypothetical protein HWV62_37831 [Athelia sp. TMB]|nr:hypothetical protein HWV62_37831 [Athelia sp. TMB]